MAEIRLAEISAALDGEATMPEGLDAEEEAFVAASLRIRAALRVEEAPVLDDLAPTVVAGPGPGRSHRRWPVAAVAAVVFAVAAVAGVLAVRPGGPVAPGPARADVGERVLAAQHTVTALDARVTVVERGVHPAVPERRLSGILRYEAPERLWLHLEQQGTPPPGWPADDIDLVVDDGRVWRRGLDGCPVSSQPACLDVVEQGLVDLPPFAAEWVAPLDLVVPADAFLPARSATWSEEGGVVSVQTTVARVAQLVDGLRSAGGIREVHATDPVVLRLDSETLTLRGLTVTAADSPARANWAVSTGYRDVPGEEILSVTVEPVSEALPAFPPFPLIDAPSAGFRDEPVLPPVTALEGFTLHRAGVLQDGGPSTRVYSFSDGRAWIRIDLTEEWDEHRLFGDLGPLVEPVEVGQGVGYRDPPGSKLALHFEHLDVVVTGSVDLATLEASVAGLGAGVPIPADWHEAQSVVDVPRGALVPRGDHIAVLDGSELVIAVGGPGQTGVVLRQRPASTLPPPAKADLIEATARGRPARYAPNLGTLTWLEDGWLRELRADGLDLATLEEIADGLVEA